MPTGTVKTEFGETNRYFRDYGCERNKDGTWSQLGRLCYWEWAGPHPVNFGRDESPMHSPPGTDDEEEVAGKKAPPTRRSARIRALEVAREKRGLEELEERRRTSRREKRRRKKLRRRIWNRTWQRWTRPAYKKRVRTERTLPRKCEKTLGRIRGFSSIREAVGSTLGLVLAFRMP